MQEAPRKEKSKREMKDKIIEILKEIQVQEAKRSAGLLIYPQREDREKELEEYTTRIASLCPGGVSEERIEEIWEKHCYKYRMDKYEFKAALKELNKQ